MISIIMGSPSDLATMRHAAETLEQLGIAYEMKSLSAHRTPEAVEAFSSGARARGVKVIIAAAGGAAHLAGVIAARTTLPVLGVPIQTSSVGGVDSLYSMVQMPGGIPVGTLAIGRAGAINAALLGAQILALSDHDLAARLEKHRDELRKKTLADDEKLQRALEGRSGKDPLQAALSAAGFKVD
jgi:5-(carboxyamino)imidazole ribonucleotide mutase